MKVMHFMDLVEMSKGELELLNQELARICALSHTRKLNRAGNCQFHGDILQVVGNKNCLPKRAVMAQVIEHTHGEIELMYRGRSLPFRAFGRYEHLRQQADADEKPSIAESIP